MNGAEISFDWRSGSKVLEGATTLSLDIRTLVKKKAARAERKRSALRHSDPREEEFLSLLQNYFLHLLMLNLITVIGVLRIVSTRISTQIVPDRARHVILNLEIRTSGLGWLV